LDGIQVVIDALEDPDPMVRRTAATALGELRTVQAVEALGRALSDPQAFVRVEAARALGLIDDDAVLPPLISALKDPATRVREVAGEALGRWRSPAVARRLAVALGSPDLRRAAGRLLAAMGAPAVEPLVEVVLEAERDLAIVAGGLLERITGPEPFVRQLSSRDPDDRMRAVEVLGAIDGPSSSEWLVASLADPEQAVRIRVVELLAELGDPRSLEPLKQVFLSDPVADVSAAAERALRRLGGMPPEGRHDPLAPVDLPEESSEGMGPASEG
jgi:HEAT repeat protein